MIEHRSIRIQDAELRTKSTTNDKGQKQIIGYASLVEHRSKPITEKISINGMPAKFETYYETIDKRAFDGADMEDTVYLKDHNPSQVFARKSAGNLELKVTEKGLMFIATLADTQRSKDLATDIEVGNYQENSFAFKVAKDQWSRDNDGVLHRHILSIKKVNDVSTVFEGAYSDTVVTSRNLHESEIQQAEVSVLVSEDNEVESVDLDFYFDQKKKTHIDSI